MHDALNDFGLGDSLVVSVTSGVLAMDSSNISCLNRDLKACICVFLTTEERLRVVSLLNEEWNDALNHWDSVYLYKYARNNSPRPS